MRIAVISDIHANYTALQEVIKDIENEKCDKIFCLGDLVLAGPQPKMTIDYVKQQDWSIIQGNTDKFIAEFNDDIFNMLKSKFPVMANAIVDDIAILDEDSRDYLKKLPAQLEFELDGVKVLLVHGSPRANNEDIMPDMPIEKIEEIIADSDADLILCGHTHIPCGYQTNNKQTVVNVGSVGRPMTANPLSCYAVVDFNDGSFSVKHKFVDYDREKAAANVRARKFDGADKLAELLINPVSRHV